MKLGEVVVPMGYYNFTMFHQNRMKNKKVFFIDHVMEVLSVKVPLRSCKVVGEFGLSGFEILQVSLLLTLSLTDSLTIYLN